MVEIRLSAPFEKSIPFSLYGASRGAAWKLGRYTIERPKAAKVPVILVGHRKIDKVHSDQLLAQIDTSVVRWTSRNCADFSLKETILSHLIDILEAKTEEGFHISC